MTTILNYEDNLNLGFIHHFSNTKHYNSVCVYVWVWVCVYVCIDKVDRKMSIFFWLLLCQKHDISGKLKISKS